MEAKPWTMTEGRTIEYKIQSEVWVRKKTNPPKKKNYFLLYLDTIGVGDTFTLDDFYTLYPNHKNETHCKQRLTKLISELIKKNILIQWKRKDEFKKLR